MSNQTFHARKKGKEWTKAKACFAEPPRVNSQKTIHLPEEIKSLLKLDEINFPTLHKGISSQDSSETEKIHKNTKSQKMFLNIVANVVIGFPFLRPKVKRKEQSPLKKKKEVVHCVPFAACQETKATNMTVLRVEPAETIEDQTFLRMEEEAKVSWCPSPQTEASASVSVPQSVCGRRIDLTMQEIFIPELELNRLLYEKDMRIHFLVQENYDLVRRAHNVKQEITHICAIKMNMEMRLSAQRMLESNAYQKVRDLERAVHTERDKAMEAETCLDREIEETSKIKTSLVQAQNQLEKSRCLWEQDESQILANHRQETYRLEGALLQVQEGGKKERFQWQLKMSRLEESLNTINQALEAMEDDNVEYVEEMMGRMRILEEIIKMEESKPKKPSLLRRFLQFFKRTRKNKPLL